MDFTAELCLVGCWGLGVINHQSYFSLLIIILILPVTVMLMLLLVSPSPVSHQYTPLSVAGKAVTTMQEDGHR